MVGNTKNFTKVSLVTRRIVICSEKAQTHLLQVLYVCILYWAEVQERRQYSQNICFFL